MHYNIREIPVAEFETMKLYVEKAYRRVNRKGVKDPIDVAIATTNMADIPMSRRKAYQLKESYAGWAFRPENYIWLRSDRNAFDMRRTAIHEIAHLRSDGDSHGAAWRKTFGIAWAMWMRAHGYSWEEVRREIYNNVRRYRHYRAWTPQGNYNFPGAYYDRLEKETTETLKAAQALCN